jgi:hypothetical protein
MSTANLTYLLLLSSILFKHNFHLVHELFAIWDHCSEDGKKIGLHTRGSNYKPRKKTKGQMYWY